MSFTKKLRCSMKKKGFTLIELMLAVSIFTIFTVFMYRFFFDEYKSYLRMQAQADLQYNASSAVDYVTYYLRNYTDLDFEDDTVVSGDKKLMDFSGTGSGAELNFSSSDRTLKDYEGYTLCRNIESISLALDGTDIVNINITLSSGSGVKRAQYEVYTSINTVK